jgi:hypothetical protein
MLVPEPLLAPVEISPGLSTTVWLWGHEAPRSIIVHALALAGYKLEVIRRWALAFCEEEYPNTEYFGRRGRMLDAAAIAWVATSMEAFMTKYWQQMHERLPSCPEFDIHQAANLVHTLSPLFHPAHAEAAIASLQTHLLDDRAEARLGTRLCRWLTNLGVIGDCPALADVCQAPLPLCKPLLGRPNTWSALDLLGERAKNEILLPRWVDDQYDLLKGSDGWHRPSQLLGFLADCTQGSPLEALKAASASLPGGGGRYYYRATSWDGARCIALCGCDYTCTPHLSLTRETYAMATLTNSCWLAMYDAEVLPP